MITFLSKRFGSYPGLLTAMLIATAGGCQHVRPGASPAFIPPLGAHGQLKPSSDSPPRSERELCIRTAAAVADRGHVSEAIALYEQAEKLIPNAVPLDRELAPLYAQAGKADHAIARYEQAVERAPKDSVLLNNYAWTLLELNRIDQAVETVEAAIGQFPDNRRLKSTRAVALYHQGHRDAAMEQFTSLYGVSAAHHNLAMLDIEAGNESTARFEVNQALATTPAPRTIQFATALGSQDRRGASAGLDDARQSGFVGEAW